MLDEFDYVMFEDLQELEFYFPKKFELVKEVNDGQPEWLIRSKDGHTVPTIRFGGLEPMSATEVKVETIIYCTTVTNLKRIRRACAVQTQEGCKYITFQRRVPQCDQRCVLLFLNVDMALGARLQFYKTGNGTIACPGNCKGAIPLSYFSRIETRIGKDQPSNHRSLTPSISSSKTSSGCSRAGDPVELLSSSYPSQRVERSCRTWLKSYLSMPHAQLQHFLHAIDDLSQSASPSMSPAGHLHDNSSAYSESDGADDIKIIVATPSVPTFSRSLSLSPKAPEFVPSGAAWHRMAHNSPVGPDPLLSARVSAQFPSSVLADKWLIVPVAIPGCGKTGICAALSHLFGFARVRAIDAARDEGAEDAYRGARKTQKFLDAISSALETNNVVLADRNNHLRRHRDQLRAACHRASEAGSARPKIVALRWCPGPRSMQDVHAACVRRVLSWRLGQQWFDPQHGDTLKRVLWKFLREVQLQPLVEEEVDAVIEMDPLDDFEVSLEVAVRGLAGIMGLNVPSTEVMADAVRAARARQPGDQ